MGFSFCFPSFSSDSGFWFSTVTLQLETYSSHLQSSPGWKSAFYFQSGLAALVFLLAYLTVDADTHHLDPSLDRRVDWLGALLVTAGLVLLTFALGDGETAKPSQWATGYVIALLIVGVLLLGAFVGWEHLLGGREHAFLSKAVGAGDVEKVSVVEEQEQEGGEGGKKVRSFYAPPLLRLEILQRAHGRLGVMLVIVFFVWAGFSGWSYYATVSNFGSG